MELVDIYLAECLGVRVDIWSPSNLGSQDTCVVLNHIIVWRFCRDGVRCVLSTLGLEGSTLLVRSLLIALLVEVRRSGLAALRHEAAAGDFLTRQNLGVAQGRGQKSGSGKHVELHSRGLEVETGYSAKMTTEVAQEHFESERTGKFNGLIKND